MSAPIAIAKVTVTLGDGTEITWNQEDMEPGAHYWTSRNFTRPPRKSSKTDPKVIPETWIHHEIRFNTDRQESKKWEAANRSQ